MKKIINHTIGKYKQNKMKEICPPWPGPSFSPASFCGKVEVAS